MQTYVVYSIIVALLIINSVILFFVGAFMVKLREDMRQFMSDVLDLASQEPVSPATARSKTWDQKFEEEIEEIQRRSRQDRGLVDPDS